MSEDCGSKRGSVWSKEVYEDIHEKHKEFADVKREQYLVKDLISKMDTTDHEMWCKIYVFLRWLNEERDDVFRSIARDIVAVPADWNSNDDHVLHIVNPYFQSKEKKGGKNENRN